MEPRLLNGDELTRSAVVANCAMNRERQLDGPNSYARELGLHPLDWLRARLSDAKTGPATWLDLCCGSGRALVQAAHELRRDGLADRIAIVGVDLVDYFVPGSAPDPPLRISCADAATWLPPPGQAFDLITCVHGLHYIGDKLSVLTRAASWLTGDGLLVADFDPASVRLPDGRPAGRALTAALRQAGFTYNARRHRITCDGRREAALPYDFLGADDQAGPGYTGQPAVNSHYLSRGDLSSV